MGEDWSDEYRQALGELGKEVRWTARRAFWRVGLPVVLFLIIGGCGLWAFNLLRQPGRIVANTFAAENVVYNYEWFKRQWQNVQATERKITNSERALAVFADSAGPRSGWTFEDKGEHGRLNTVLLGLRNYRQDLVAEYNARSQMANRAIFKSGELPTSIGGGE